MRRTKRTAASVQDYANKVYDRVFERAQHLWWGSLNDAMEWDTDWVQRFSELFVENCKLPGIDDDPKYAAEMVEEGFDPKEIREGSFAKQVWMNMIPKELKKHGANELFVAMQASKKAIGDCFYIGIYTLLHNYLLTGDTVEKIMDAYVSYSSAYLNKKQDPERILKEFFTENVGEIIDIDRVVRSAQMWDNDPDSED